MSIFHHLFNFVMFDFYKGLTYEGHTHLHKFSQIPPTHPCYDPLPQLGTGEQCIFTNLATHRSFDLNT